MRAALLKRWNELGLELLALDPARFETFVEAAQLVVRGAREPVRPVRALPGPAARRRAFTVIDGGLVEPAASGDVQTA